MPLPLSSTNSNSTELFFHIPACVYGPLMGPITCALGEAVQYWTWLERAFHSGSYPEVQSEVGYAAAPQWSHIYVHMLV